MDYRVKRDKLKGHLSLIWLNNKTELKFARV